MLRTLVLSTLTAAGLACCGCASAGRAVGAAGWRTRAERSAYVETARYPETVGFCRSLAEASPLARYMTFGRSGEGRELPLLVLSGARAFTPAAARSSGRPLVLVQNCIHAGECDGKDACLALARDILITGTRAELLRRVNLLIIPIFNVDGHERFGPHNRINQLGPREMGWRTTAANLNLNRDYLKADAVEMRAWLRLWTDWQPDLFIDTHTTDGSDHQYDLLYAATTDALTAAPVARWTQDFLPAVVSALEADGHLVLPYGEPRDRRDPTQGIAADAAFLPRFSTGYGAICNRPSILIEAHALKPYERRVQATYAMLVRCLEALSRSPETLRAAVREADEQTRRTRGAGDDGRVPLRTTLTDESVPLLYRGVEAVIRHSDITGSEIIAYSDRPADVPSRLFNKTRIDAAVVPPAAYLIPPPWREVIERLEWHGIGFFRLKRAEQLQIESYRFEDVTFPSRPYEGRFPANYVTVPTRETREFVAGTVVVPLNQARARVAVHLLEPEAPDSLIAWGFFNAIFEQKEYAEVYALEPIAQRMLEDDPLLREEFEQKLRTDPAFAADPGARLRFFYQRSPYWDQRQNVYPVARLMDEMVLQRIGK